MAIAGPAATDLEAQRMELAEVLHSEQFTRAPMLAHLLSYLCEKLFDGKAHEIKEYSVGVEVFHRGANFDQNSDSIVRVEANRLRKRLAAYYAGEGAAHRLQIRIPLGQYVPEFVSAAALALDNSLAPAIATQSQPPQERSRFSTRRVWWLGGALALLVIALGSGLLSLHQTKPRPTATELNPSVAPTEEAQLGPPVGEEIRILAGSTRGFVDHAGKLWTPDAWFDGGTAVKSSVENIRRAPTPDFYRSSRQGSFRYAIPLKKGIYELHLYFAETVYDPESSATEEEGYRLMSVRINGYAVLTRFDIVADAGGSRTADVKVFTDIAPAPDGLLHLEFSGDEGRQAILSAIEILPGFRGHIRPVRLLARQTPYYSNDSHWWSPDNYYEGGRLASYSAPVSGTDDPELYETERWGNFSYAIPVAPGKYTLLLHFAVRHGDWDQAPSDSGEKRAAVAHVFNLFCNGNALLNHFNLPQEAGQTDVAVQKFTGLEPNAQGKLLLSFVPVEGYATVTGIEVLPQ